MAHKKTKDKSWVPPAGMGDYTKARRAWNPTFEELSAALRRRSRARGLKRLRQSRWRPKPDLMGLKIYLDNCTLGRPEDPQGGRVARQGEAVLDIIEGVRQERWVLLRSSAHEDEASPLLSKLPARHARIMERLDLAAGETLDAALSRPLYDELRAVPRGKAPLLKPPDALHLATAVWYGATIFVTVDRDLYLWGRAHRSLLRGTRVMWPGEFLEAFANAKVAFKEEE